MIVVISDLHLQHTACDALRRNEGGRVLETRIVRNVSAQALSLLFSEIVENAERVGAKEAHLVFAGDIFELHRTPLWLLGGERLRPTLHPAASSSALETKVHSILDAIERDNHEFFQVLSKFVTTGALVHRGEEQTLENVAVIPHYLPGNHDRLVGVWPSTRQRVRELLCVRPPAEGASGPFLHRLDWDRAAGYGVRVRHGHEYDPANFSENFDPAQPASGAAYDAPTLGDFVTVDIATRLAVAFRAHYARELRTPGADGERYRRVYATLTEFDDVRPQSMLVHYLTHAVGASEDVTFSMLRPVLRDAFETAMADSFFVSQADRLGLAKYFQGGLAKLIDEALKKLTGNEVGELLSVLDKFRHETRSGGPAAIAQREPGLSTGDLSVVVAGHTHEPDHVAMPGERLAGAPDGDAYFLDSGTWRTRIDAGVSGAFGRLRGYTMVFCYHDAELRHVGDRRRFETWTGHLQAEDYGPTLSLDVTPATRPELQSVRFVECRVQHVDEGETHDGAELVLYFGVDGVGQKISFDHVRDGQILTLPDTAVAEVDPTLDGEVWCYGIEEDLGDSVLDRDDPMPWAVCFLARASREVNAAFVPGRIELRAEDNRGNAFTIICGVT
jgi:hypothetical protein